MYSSYSGHYKGTQYIIKETSHIRPVKMKRRCSASIY